MDALLDKIAAQAPALCVLVYLVIRFLGALEKRDETIKVIATEAKEAHAQSTEAIKENTKVIGRNLQAHEMDCDLRERQNQLMDRTARVLEKIENRGSGLHAATPTERKGDR